MKTYIKTTLTILISGMLFSSCEDQLNQANPNQATEDTFWKDEPDRLGDAGNKDKTGFSVLISIIIFVLT